jgi:YfiH family protein
MTAALYRIRALIPGQSVASAMILTSQLLAKIPGIRHGFSTRLGGVSAGPFATLNLDRSVGDEDSRVGENRARFAIMLGLSVPVEIVQVQQVHGTRIVGHREAKGSSADGITADEPGVLIGVRTADCVPILIAALDGRGRPERVAAVHAGWRGATAGILAEAVHALIAQGCDRSRLHFALGPAIAIEDFEVGDEVIEAARRSVYGKEPPAVRGPNGRWHLDLLALLERHLAGAQIDPARVDRVRGSTYSEPALFFSHRRERGHTGRHISAIAYVAS